MTFQSGHKTQPGVLARYRRKPRRFSLGQSTQVVADEVELQYPIDEGGLLPYDTCPIMQLKARRINSVGPVPLMAQHIRGAASQPR